MLDLRPWISKNSKKVTSRPSNNKTGRARESKILKKFNVVNMINISACNEGRKKASASLLVDLLQLEGGPD